LAANPSPKEVVMSIRTEPGIPCPTPVGASRREEMIKQAAYFRSQHRQPCSGKESEDWLAAEEQIDRMLTGYA
jgi:Protein of unknown function (DUF2934)